jgi:hypothetical protein
MHTHTHIQQVVGDISFSEIVFHPCIWNQGFSLSAACHQPWTPQPTPASQRPASTQPASQQPATPASQAAKPALPSNPAQPASPARPAQASQPAQPASLASQPSPATSWRSQPVASPGKAARKFISKVVSKYVTKTRKFQNFNFFAIISKFQNL